MKFKKTVLLVLLAALFGELGGAQAKGEPAGEQADQGKESWRKEFDDVCSKTQDAMSLREAELTDLIRRCDALVPQIEKLDESRKKVYLGRLRMCRGLYVYVLDSKKNQKK